MKVGIAGMGYYLPKRVMTNKELEQYADVTDEWIQKKIGIKERRIAADNECLSDMAYPAALNAIKNSGIKSEDIELIIVCAINQDCRVPSTAVIMQKKLGACNAAAFDINVGGCPGSCYSLVVAQQFIENEMYKNVLVIAGDIYSKLVDISDKYVSVYFGDGVGAAVLRRCKEGSGFETSLIGADGEWGADCIVCEGGSRVPITEKAFKQNKFKITLDGREVWKFGTKLFPLAIRQLAANVNCETKDIDWIIPHQANINMIEFGMNELHLPMDKAYINLQKYANTGAGSVMIALAEASEKGLIKPGQRVALASFGAGFAWGAVLIKWCCEEDFIDS
ncbi:MAG: beta-ketoacyl-ACP synthase 3 [Lachnospiraceae bacterium]|nr:beta-ketoacyl-ACP synthase 3 [Lachnospiraceae bacterium]